jgi:NADPH-dependent ferric siderophore reductase
MHQVTLGGAGLIDFPSGQAGGYIKLHLSSADQPGKSLIRTYTIRAQRADAIDVQFALHGNQSSGPATSWALDAQIGDTIVIGGPGPAKPLPHNFDFYLVAGDMTALPAISANLENLSRDAKGVAVIEIQSESDAVAIAAPDGMELRWLVNPSPGGRPELLANELRSAAAQAWGRIAGWAASEFLAMRELRQLLRDDLGLGPQELYISSYWKLGLDESEHKMVKREDALAQPA